MSGYEWLEQPCGVCDRPLGDHLVFNESGMPHCPDADTRFQHWEKTS